MKLFKYLRDNGYAAYYPTNFAYLRMADIHLCYAEALAQTGNLQKACDEMNKVRARVGLGKVEIMNPELNLCLLYTSFRWVVSTDKKGDPFKK